MGLLIFTVIASLALSFICSILEAALLSITPSYVAQLKQVNVSFYEKIKKLKDLVDQPLAAILTLNTIAHTVGATVVGAQVTALYGDSYLGVASAVMTVLVLVLSEILPKSIGARYWRNLVPYLPRVLNSMIFFLKPFIWLSDRIVRLFKGKAVDANIRQEIKALSILGREQGSLDEDEQRVIANVLDLHDVLVRDIMTPRAVCETVSPDMTIQEFNQRVEASNGFSRYPILDEQENPLGVLFRYDLINADPKATVMSLCKPVTVITEKINAEKVLQLFLSERQHLFVVYDEYGSWLGLITMEDVIETLIGKAIMDETDEIPNMRRLAKKKWDKKRKALAEETEL